MHCKILWPFSQNGFSAREKLNELMCIVQISAVQTATLQTAHIFGHSFGFALTQSLGIFDNCSRTTHIGIATIESKSTNNNAAIAIAMTSIQCRHQDGAYIVVWSRFNMNLSMSFMFSNESVLLTYHSLSLFPLKFQHLHQCCCCCCSCSAQNNNNHHPHLQCHSHHQLLCSLLSYSTSFQLGEPKWMNIEMLSRACISICIPTVLEYVHCTTNNWNAK